MIDISASIEVYIEKTMCNSDEESQCAICRSELTEENPVVVEFPTGVVCENCWSAWWPNAVSPIRDVLLRKINNES